MEKKDRDIRIQWLIGLALSFIMSLGRFLYQLQLNPPLILFPYSQVVAILFPLIGLFGFSFVFYRCAYKKPGTKLLFLVLFINGCSLMLAPITFLAKISLLSSYVSRSYGEFFFSMATGILWFFLCWRMRELNKKIRKEQIKT